MSEPPDRRAWLRKLADPQAPEDPGTDGEDIGAHGAFEPDDTRAHGEVVTADVPMALQSPVVEPLLLTTVQVSTISGGCLLTRASGFFYRAGRSLYLVTSRHVLFDPGSGHLPDTVEFDVHTDAGNLALSGPLQLPLYSGGRGLWRQGRDRGGDVDVAVLEVPRDRLPRTAVIHVFTEEHLLSTAAVANVGAPVLLVGFPLGFHDTLHHLPVVRHAIIASSFSLRFQGIGCFLTDGRAHRGASGAPVVVRAGAPRAAFPWKLLGVHSSRFDMGNRDFAQDESLGLNCAWYADILRALTC